MMKSRIGFLVAGLLILPLVFIGVTNSTVEAQGNNPPRNCPQLVRDAIDDFALNCANIPYNTACYGYDDVQARFDDEPEMLDPDFVAGSWTPLQTYASVITGAMNVDDEVWGLAALKEQDGIPRGLVEELPTDPGILFMMFGDVEVESAVPMENQYIPVESPLAVATTADTDAKVDPVATADTLGIVIADTTLFADGISPDGNWVRVAYEMQAAWVALADLAPADVSGLPVIGPDSMTPMQSFYLRTGNNPMECNQAVPDMLLMQTPEDVISEVVLDGVPVQMDSATVITRVLAGNTLRFDVIGGFITLYPDTPNEVIIPAGFSYTACTLTPPDDLDGHDEEPNDQIADCVGGLPVPITNQERQDLQALEGMPDNLFNYEIRIPRGRRGSGVGGPIDEVIIDPDSPAYDRIIRNCELGRIPAEVCERLVGFTPDG